MRLVLALAFSVCLAAGPTARACERPASNGGVFFDVRILIVNVSDACAIRFIVLMASDELD